MPPPLILDLERALDVGEVGDVILDGDDGGEAPEASWRREFLTS